MNTSGLTQSFEESGKIVGDGSSRDQMFGVSSSRFSAGLTRASSLQPTSTTESYIDSPEPDDCSIEAILKGALQLGAILYTLVLPDENGVMHVHELPLDMVELIRQASLCASMEDDNAQHFLIGWKKYAGESADPRIQLHADRGWCVLHETFTNGFRDIAWAIAGLSSKDITLFLQQLGSVNDCLLSRFYAKQCGILKKFASLLESLDKLRNDELVPRRDCFLTHLSNNSSEITIFPVLGKDHAVYMVVLPPAVQSDTALFTVIFCDGSGGDKYHFTKVEDAVDGVRGHCIVQLDYAGVEDILHDLATFWRSPLIHGKLSKRLKSIGLREVVALQNKGDVLFPGESVHMELQSTGNCGLHNLLEALWFCCSPGFRDVDSLQLRYCMLESAFQWIIKYRLNIEAFCDRKGYVDGYILAERYAWKSLDTEFELICKHLDSNSECVMEIKATHTDKSVGDDAFKEAMEMRTEFMERVMGLFSDGIVDEESLSNCFRNRLSQEQLDELVSSKERLKILYANGGPPPPPPKQKAFDIL